MEHWLVVVVFGWRHGGGYGVHGGGGGGGSTIPCNKGPRSQTRIYGLSLSHGDMQFIIFVSTCVVVTIT